MCIKNMLNLSAEQLNQAATILSDSLPLGWSTPTLAFTDITKLLTPKNTLLAFLDNDIVIGFGGITPIYNGNVFELHPLAIKSTHRKIGIGTKIVHALESAAKSQGGLTIWLGADDDLTPTETSFGDTNLFINFPKQLSEFTPNFHQTAFYLKLGYTIMGALPNANGKGKPDIFLAKSLCN